MDASVSVGTPFVAVAAKVAREEKQAESDTTKRLYMTGLWHYEMAKLTLQSVRWFSGFIKAIDAALNPRRSL